jgi:type IV pilus assembly protein PilX
MNDSMIQRNVHRQRGAVLMVSLVMLILVTLIGVAIMQTSNMEVVMVSNAQSRMTAMSEAENALVDGEREITTDYPGTPSWDWSAVTTDGLYTAGDFAGSIVDVVDWNDDVAGAYQTGPSGAKYATEYLGPYTTAGASLTMGAGGAVDKRYLYRVSGRGEFGNGGTRFVESIFATTD